MRALKTSSSVKVPATQTKNIGTIENERYHQSLLNVDINTGEIANERPSRTLWIYQLQMPRLFILIVFSKELSSTLAQFQSTAMGMH